MSGFLMIPSFPEPSKARLAALGLGQVVASGHDTCADEDRFFSYRRSVLRGEKGYGRGLSAIALVP